MSCTNTIVFHACILRCDSLSHLGTITKIHSSIKHFKMKTPCSTQLRNNSQLTFEMLYVHNRNIRHTLGVVHAHGRVVIDCRIPQEGVIGIVSTMGTKESISYKMISHGSWCRQIEKERKKEKEQQPGQERGRKGKATAKSGEGKKKRKKHSRRSGDRRKERRYRVEVSKREVVRGGG